MQRFGSLRRAQENSSTEIASRRKERKNMQENIHPTYYKTVARCACGNEIEVGSTKENIRVEICSKCHPFYTGDRQRIVDTTGRVDRFKKKYGLK